MPVIHRVAFGLLCSLTCVSLYAQHSDNSGSLDLYVFSQQDDGGNPYQNEDLLYYGARAAARLKVSDTLTLRPTIGVAQIEAGGKPDTPSTVTNATVTSASQQGGASGGATKYTPITTSMGFDIKPAGTKLTLSPGFFFSYQDNYVSRGLDFSASIELFNGNLIPSLSYGLRYDTLTSDTIGFWGIFGIAGEADEGDHEGEDEEEEEEEEEGEEEGARTAMLGLRTRISHNLQLGFTQIISPEWRLNASVQYTRQDGYLGAPNAVVTLYDGNTPVLLSDERLPNYRNRFQFNLRVKYSPLLGLSFGVDHSAYFDDWGILNLAAEPSAEGFFVRDIARWRVWYRFSYQDGTRFMRDHPQQKFKFQTDDPDLGSFTTHGGGALFYFDVAHWGPMHWIVRVSGYAISRSDGIWGIGALLGTEFTW
ncbi:MAG: DUF3570 domain-containing protein [Planctomycetes bacterium]|nr:DUF3570 domain-containing protein [Planctomycetota bacterium]